MLRWRTAVASRERRERRDVWRPERSSDAISELSSSFESGGSRPIRAGVLDLRGEGDTAGYSGIDLRLLDILGDVRRLGLGDGFPISVAEPYMIAVKQLVEFEIDVFRHRALSSGIPTNLPEMARQAVDLGERLILALRAKLLPGVLERLAAMR